MQTKSTRFICVSYVIPAKAGICRFEFWIPGKRSALSGMTIKLLGRLATFGVAGQAAGRYSQCSAHNGCSHVYP